MRQQKGLRLFTAVWGEKHLDWLERGCLTSLKWPKNKEALENAVWAFMTKKADMPRLEKMVDESGINIKDIEFYQMDDSVQGDDPRMGNYLLQAWLQEMARSITYGCQTLIAPPDTIFGEGSIQNLRSLAEGRDTVVFAAHPRVTPAVLDAVCPKLPEAMTPLSNAKLVRLAWENLHATWRDAEVGLAQSNSYIGGVCWRFLDENLYAVTHRLPTPYLINFTPEDIVYFKNQLEFGVLDHAWPGAVLCNLERMRVVGSSDAVFIVEMTEKDKNIPPVEYVRQDEPDAFWRNHPHNKINRQFSIIFRGENA